MLSQIRYVSNSVDKTLSCNKWCLYRNCFHFVIPGHRKITEDRNRKLDVESF